MSDDRLRVAVIIGSTRRGRFGPTVADWFVRQARRRPELTVDLVDLAEAELPEALGDGDERPPEPVRRLAPRLTSADAFVVVTPEYNRSVPAPLKLMIDWYDEPWRAKPVTVVAYGRDSGGWYAVEQLRQMFTELNAVTIRNTVILPCYWDLFAADGSWPKPSADCRIAAGAALDQLTWWAYALRDARAARPYRG
ncbi:NADPH-dependent FMN reductase [Plantactinospora sp. GCM10030261]|uniref:NADPH-dependent FMN reductase n=1 Tax=Plantactinospora sp. GCM10030261 TaxID=3273420 RepID=UPI003610A485